MSLDLIKQEHLAQLLHTAEARVIALHLNTLLPQWSSLAPMHKQHYRARARELMERYGE